MRYIHLKLYSGESLGIVNSIFKSYKDDGHLLRTVFLEWFTSV